MFFDWLIDLLAFTGRRKKTVIKYVPQPEPLPRPEVRVKINPLPAGVKFPEFCLLCDAAPERFERLCTQVFEYLVCMNEPLGRVIGTAENLIECYAMNRDVRAAVTCVSEGPDLVFIASVTADDIGVQRCKITVGGAEDVEYC